MATKLPRHGRIAAAQVVAAPRTLTSLTQSRRLPIVAQSSIRRLLLGVGALGLATAFVARRTDSRPPSRQLSSKMMLASHTDLVRHLQKEGLLKTERVRDAYLAVDRAPFMDPSIPSAFIYTDSPMPIGNQQTISAPHMHAACLDLLAEQLQPGACALDVGSGSGYLTAVMGRLVSPRGSVLGIEKWADLAERSIQSIKACQPQLLESDPPVVTIKAGNALGDVLEDDSRQYDAIHVGAAAATMPEKLIRKLNPGGRMIIPVGRQEEFQTLQCVDKTKSGEIREQPLMHVRYVPLVEAKAEHTA